jgi:hypothetical protein
LNRDLVFLSRQFETIELPREKAYLYKYFKTKLQDAFLKYFFAFGDYTHFTAHTGLRSEYYWLKNLHCRLVQLEELHRTAKQNADLTTLAKIESGKYKL